MVRGSLILAGALMGAPLLAAPAAAEDVEFKGHVLDVDASQASRPILRMTGTRHVINRSAQQLAEKARGCLASGGGVVIEPQDAAGAEPFTVWVRVDFGSMFSARNLRSQWTLEAGDGYFRIVQSGFGFAQVSGREAVAGDYLPLAQDGMPWKNALEAALPLESTLVDCLYR